MATTTSLDAHLSNRSADAPVAEPLVETLVHEWCLEGDASVILPRLRDRIVQQGATEASPLSVEASPDSVRIDRNEDSIAKRIASAMLRKVRTHLNSPHSNYYSTPDQSRSAFERSGGPAADPLDLVGGVGQESMSPSASRARADTQWRRQQHHSPVPIAPPSGSPPSGPAFRVAAAASAGTACNRGGEPAFAMPSMLALPTSAIIAEKEDDEQAATATADVVDSPLIRDLVPDGVPPDHLRMSFGAVPCGRRHNGSFSMIDAGATMPPNMTPSQLGVSTSTESKVRKELTHALSDACKALLTASRQHIAAQRQSTALAARVQQVEAELAAAKAMTARLEMDLLLANNKPREGHYHHHHQQPTTAGASVPPTVPQGSRKQSTPRSIAVRIPSAFIDQSGVSGPSSPSASDDPTPLATPSDVQTRPPPLSFSDYSGDSVGDLSRTQSKAAFDLPRTQSKVTFGDRRRTMTLRGMATMVRAMAVANHNNQQRRDSQTIGIVPSRSFRMTVAAEPPAATLAMPPAKDNGGNAFVPPPILSLDDILSPTGRSPLTAKGSGVFPTTLLPVRMQPRVEESIDDIGMPMLNQYVILSELGAGCQGTVNLALDTETEELRAIKVIARPIATSGVGARKQRENAAKLAQLQREIAIMKRCRHRNVVALFEVIDDPEADSMYLVMQYVEKGSVAKQTDNGETTPIDGATLASYAKQLCSGLQYLHSRGIVHRDVKPENLLLGANGVVYLSDFGISSVDETSGVMTPRHCGASGPTSGEFSQHAPAARGTVAFLAPEVLNSSAASTPSERTPHSTVAAAADSEARADLAIARATLNTKKEKHADGCAADVWALGMSLYVMLYGQLPWPATDAADFTEKLMSADAAIPYPATTREGRRIMKHVEWTYMLSKMLCRDVKKRMTVAEAHATAKALEREYAAAEMSGSVADDEVQHAFTAVRRTN